MFTSTPKPNFLKLLLLSLLYEVCSLHETEVHNWEFTHKSPLPVSKMTGIDWPGEPIEIIPTYWVFLKFFNGINFVEISFVSPILLLEFEILLLLLNFAFTFVLTVVIGFEDVSISWSNLFK